MKKVLSLLMIASIVSLASCGAEEEKKDEKKDGDKKEQNDEKKQSGQSLIFLLSRFKKDFYKRSPFFMADKKTCTPGTVQFGHW